MKIWIFKFQRNEECKRVCFCPNLNKPQYTWSINQTSHLDERERGGHVERVPEAIVIDNKSRKYNQLSTSCIFEPKLLRVYSICVRFSKMTELNCTVEFKGGLELLFDNCKQKELTLSTSDQMDDKFTIRMLIKHLKENHLRERPELFVSGDDIRPGVLIIINETDSELLGHLDYELKNNDNVLFISTLHGG